MKAKIELFLIWSVLILILVGFNRILNYPYTSGSSYMNDDLPEDVREELNEEARQNFINEQLF